MRLKKIHRGARGDRGGRQREAAETMFQQNRVEVDQESRFNPAQTQVRERLRLMKTRDLVNRLHFHDQNFLHNQVDAIARIRSMSFVGNRQCDLALVRDTKLSK